MLFTKVNNSEINQLCSPQNASPTIVSLATEVFEVLEMNQIQFNAIHKSLYRSASLRYFKSDYESRGVLHVAIYLKHYFSRKMNP